MRSPRTRFGARVCRPPLSGSAPAACRPSLGQRTPGFVLRRPLSNSPLPIVPFIPMTVPYYRASSPQAAGGMRSRRREAEPLHRPRSESLVLGIRRIMNILVTGGAGFIGSHLCERLLREGHRLTILDDLNDFYDPQWKRENLAIVSQQGAVCFEEASVCD